ncbi:glycosyltransferase family 2 protein [Roseivivax sp. CAU 1753]
MSRWGIVSTIKAPLPRILEFAAWHLEEGAERIFVYLDDGDAAAMRALSRHPKLRVVETDAAYWDGKGGRPDKHQNRQCRNARHANNRKTEVDWLAHIDVDEFLLCRGGIAASLDRLPPECLCARVRPIEALAPVETPGISKLFKAFHLDQAKRNAAAERVFGPWAQHLSGGFLSHVAGKLFFRPGTKGLQIRIHNVILDGQQNPGERALTDIELGHFHAASWESFRAAYRFRLDRGSYRDALNPQARSQGALKLFDLFRQIESAQGEDGLRAFYDAVATASPTLVADLEAEGLLRRYPMDLPRLVQRHFPAC